MNKTTLVKNLAKEDLIAHLKDLKQQIETRLIGQRLAELSIKYTQDHSQDFRRDDLNGVLELGAFVHDEILSTDMLFDSLVSALDKRVLELES
ncbi:hypothetical protein [Desulfotalea psychrophila]|uniref:Uncharacterized protein n=1 Tax=Desulfotalea psychrophila (strain LSv54 / DSM 12343) TaxID=177439 RepID=Q6APK2_DESPS|nr:hypothetical protein [Desulfotalea psychrophila]CAG35722.1 unknown protein [Desulfotalea psychrophila LSv54]